MYCQMGGALGLTQKRQESGEMKKWRGREAILDLGSLDIQNSGLQKYVNMQSRVWEGYFFKHFYLFWAIPCSTQGLLLALHSRMTPGRLLGLYWMPRNESRLGYIQWKYPTHYTIYQSFQPQSLV